MKTAYAEWRDLESVSGKPLLFITGSLCFGTTGNPYGRAARQSLDAAGVESEWWDAAELTERFSAISRVQRHGHPLAEGHRFPSCR